MTRLSEVTIESIGLWIRIYDVPVDMTDGFVRALGGKVGRVVLVGDAVQDYKRVKIDFSLAKTIMHTVQQKVRGHGTLEFAVRYENIPFFCFWCGRIGHDKRECPEEIPEVGGVRFGEALRCSPQKREVGRRQTIRPLESNACRGLNFCGEQKEKFQAARECVQSSEWGIEHLPCLEKE